MPKTIRLASKNTRIGGTWKIFFQLVLGGVLLWGAVTSLRIWVMTDRLDHYIFEYGFVGPAYIVFGVPNADPAFWNEGHNGWDFNISTDTQVLFTVTSESEVSFYSSNEMKQPDGSLMRLPYKDVQKGFPYAAIGPRSAPIDIDIGNGKYVRFWTRSPITLCDPCLEDQEYPQFRERASLRAWVISELTRRIQTGEIPISSLELLEYQ